MWQLFGLNELGSNCFFLSSLFRVCYIFFRQFGFNSFRLACDWLFLHAKKIQRINIDEWISIGLWLKSLFSVNDRFLSDVRFTWWVISWIYMCHHHSLLLHTFFRMPTVFIRFWQIGQCTRFVRFDWAHKSN